MRIADVEISLCLELFYTILNPSQLKIINDSYKKALYNRGTTFILSLARILNNIFDKV